MKYYSHHWDEKNGVCMKHGVPQLPCPSCMSPPFEDVKAVMESLDVVTLDFDPEATLADLLVSGFPLEQVQIRNNY